MSDLLKKHQQTIRANTVLFKEGDTSKETYILLKGSVAVLKNGQHIVDIDEQGSFLGEMATLIGEVRSATIKTKVDSIFIVLDENNLESLIQQMPVLGIKMSKSLARRLSVTTQELIEEKEKNKRLMAGGASPAAQKEIAKSEIEKQVPFERRIEILTELLKEKTSEDDDYERVMEIFEDFQGCVAYITDKHTSSGVFQTLTDIAKKFGCDRRYFIMIEQEAGSKAGAPVSVPTVIDMPVLSDDTDDNDMQNTDDIFKNAMQCAKSGEFEEALTLFEEIIKQDAAYLNAYTNGALACVRLNKFSRAKELFEQALAIDPENEKAKKNLALVLKKL